MRHRAVFAADARRYRRVAADGDGRADAEPVTGMQNIHGPLEWISVQDMARATEVCIALTRLWSEHQT